MSTQIMQAVVLICDGCKTELGTTGEFRSAMDARAAAYAEGWRFPPKLKANGQPSNNTSDVCPKCLDDWAAPTRMNPNRNRQYRPIPAE